MTSPAAPPTTARCQWLSGLAGLQLLRAEWDALAAQLAPDSAFHRHDWAVAWTEVFAPDDLQLLVLRSEDQVAGIVPLVPWPGTVLGLPIRRYCLLGGLPTGTTDLSRAGALLARDLRWGWGATTPLLVHPTCLDAAFAEVQAKLRADLIQIQGLPTASLAATGPFVPRVELAAPTFCCHTGGNMLGRQRLSKRTRKRFADGLAELEAKPGFRLAIEPASALGPRDLGELADLEARSRKSASGASILTSGAENREFLASLCRHVATAKVTRLHADGRLIAWAFALAAGQQGTGLLLAHDPAYDDQHAGALAYVLLEEALAGAAPLRSYDLGRGEAFWKTQRFLGTPEPRFDLLLYGPTWRGRLLRLVHAWAERLLHRPRAAVPEPAPPPRLAEESR